MQSLQDSYINKSLGKEIDSIYILEDKNLNEIDTIILKENSIYYQIFLDENILFLHPIDTTIESYLEDMDKKIVANIINKVNTNLKFDGSTLELQSSQYTIELKTINDLFSYPIIKLK